GGARPGREADRAFVGRPSGRRGGQGQGNRGDPTSSQHHFNLRLDGGTLDTTRPRAQTRGIGAGPEEETAHPTPILLNDPDRHAARRERRASMPVLPLVLGLLLPTAEPALSPTAGYRPSGPLVELYDLDRLPLLRDPAISWREFRGDDVPDGDHETVLAEVDGPGILVRLSFFALKGNTQFRFFIDGKGEPA